MTRQEVASLLAKTAEAAASGKFEPFNKHVQNLMPG